jgi:arylsulfatase A-like enzyme
MKPNILLITTDQQRYDSVGHRAPPFMRSPHYTNLCDVGTEFLNAYAQSPLCVPMRYSTMTGTDMGKCRIHGNFRSSEHMGRDETLPGRLRPLGYQTIAVGKMHFGPQRTRHGFDEMILPDDYHREMAIRGGDYQPMRHGLGQNEQTVSGMATVPEALTLTSWTTERCVDYIRYRRDPTVPFFMWCSYSKPHPPWDPPEPYYSMYRNQKMPGPVVGDWSRDTRCPEPFKRMREQYSMDLVTPEVWQENYAAYLGLCTQIDYNLGRLFGVMREAEVLNNTLIIFTSDHGEMMGDHGSGAKVFFYESSARVPFVMVKPKSMGGWKTGERCEFPVTHCDIMPTILAAAGETENLGDGVNLLGIHAQTPCDRLIEGVCAGEVLGYSAATDGKVKYIYYPEGGCEQFFDLVADPGELHNAAGDLQHQETVAKLRNHLIALHTERNTGWVQDGKWAVWPLRGDTTQQRRAQNWKGFHTEICEDDTRH